MTWSSRAFEDISRFLLERAGLLFAEERHPGIEAAIRRAMAASGVELPCSYLELVSANPAELDNLLS